MNNSGDITRKLLLNMTLISGIIVCICIAYIFGKNLHKETIVSSLSYNETISDQLKVYYQENDFYTKGYYTINDSPFLGSLIDNIDLDFDYYMYFSNEIYGSYKYNVIATLYVYEPGNENDPIWTKDYMLLDEDMVSYSAKDYRLQKTVNIKYQDYLNEYKAYSRLSKVSSNAKIIVRFEVNNEGTYNSLPKISTKSYEYISIPLTESTFKVSKTTNVSKDDHVIKNSVKSEGDRIFSIIVIVLCVLLATVLVIIFIVAYKNDQKRESLYARKLKKIITAYDNILVSVKTLPETKELNVVNVTSFDELVDAQSEVRLPINYKEDSKKKTTKFILIRNDMAWVYTLKEGDLEDEKKA